MTATLSPEQKTQPAIRPAAEVAPATARSVDERPDAPDLQVVPGGPAALHVDHVTKRFVVGRGKPPVVAIDAVSLRLERGEIVGILADRGLRDERECRCEFLGAPARFPLGPLLLAGLLQAPVILAFGLYRGGRRYEVKLEPFAERIELDRRDREGSLRPWVERYAARLEHHCRESPDNWVNFYDFWAPGGA